MSKRTEFHFSPNREPHRDYTKALLKKHPEIRKLIGKDSSTIYYILAITIAQITLAWLLKDQAWWLIVVVAYTAGAFLGHGMFVMVHECAHNLLFKKRHLNLWAGMLANLAQVFPASVTFQRYHIKHHVFQGILELDADLPSQREANLVKNSTIGKAIWLLLYPFVQISRMFRLKEIKPIDRWVVTNWSVQIVFTSLVLFFWGPSALIYLLLSLFFSVGLHPLGARWIQEHYLTLDNNQETYSYYGGLNKVAFNVGYHNEHHDFPSVSWKKLPQITKIAADHYDNLASHLSWTKLLFMFLFNRDISLYSLVIRKDRGKVSFNDPSKPDVELFDKKKVLSEV